MIWKILLIILIVMIITLACAHKTIPPPELCYKANNQVFCPIHKPKEKK